MELPRLLHPRRVARCHLRRRREEGRLLSHAVQPLGAQGNLCARATSPGVAGELWEEEEEVVRSPPPPPPTDPPCPLPPILSWPKPIHERLGVARRS